MTLAQARAFLKVHEELTFAGVQAFPHFTEEDAAAWSQLVTCAKRIVMLAKLDAENAEQDAPQ